MVEVSEARRDILDAATVTESTNGPRLSTEGVTRFSVVADLHSAGSSIQMFIQESNDQSSILYDWQLSEDNPSLGHWRAEGSPSCAFIRVVISNISGSATYSLRDVSR